MIIKYKVERSFKDKNTKKSIFVDETIDIDIARMKELNSKNIGRVIDIIEDVKIEPETPEISEENGEQIEPQTPEISEEKGEQIEPEKPEEDKEPINPQEKQYTKEELSSMTVNDLKDLAVTLEIELTKAKKDEIVEEILEKNK